MQGHIDPDGFWIKGSIGVFNINSDLPTSTAPSWHFEHFEWPRALVSKELGQKFLSLK